MNLDNYFFLIHFFFVGFFHLLWVIELLVSLYLSITLPQVCGTHFVFNIHVIQKYIYFKNVKRTLLLDVYG